MQMMFNLSTITISISAKIAFKIIRKAIINFNGTILNHCHHHHGQSSIIVIIIIIKIDIISINLDETILKHHHRH
jgi:hypothetical protein